MPNFEQKPTEGGEKIQFITQAELQGMVNEFRDTITDNGVGHTQKFGEQIDLYEKFIDSLLKQSDRFAHIFRTEQGSVYFVLEDGHSFRVKRKEYSYELEPIADKIEYLTSDIPREPVADGRAALGLTPYETIFFTEHGERKPYFHLGDKITEIIK